jgi:L-aminopeptidase/D-esterase-like protein
MNAGSITDVPGIKVGHAHNKSALTGCTVVLTEQGAVCGVDVRGSAPGTRETDLLQPTHMVDRVHAILLSGGSAYGLDAATGVMQFLEERGYGLPVGVGVVPIVPAAVLFDLAIGNSNVRPDKEMGYQAAQNASADCSVQGNVGAGCGATVGKLAGLERAMKSGLGTASRTLPNGLVVGAIVAVNAVGEVRHPKTGQVLVAPCDDEGNLLDSLDLLMRMAHAPVFPGTNTTIGVVASNANLNKAQATKVAQMAHDGLARTIYPVHTMLDGDTLFAVATGGLDVPVDVVGAVSAEVLADAVVNAVKAAEAAGGLPSYQNLQQSCERAE